MESIKIRFFGSKDCEKCQALIKAFEYHSIAFDYIDADAAETEQLCDEQKVDKLPHLQALSEDNKVFLNYIGYISPPVFVERVREFSKQLSRFLASKKEGTVKKEIDEPTKNKSGCSSCSKKRNAKS